MTWKTEYAGSSNRRNPDCTEFILRVIKYIFSLFVFGYDRYESKPSISNNMTGERQFCGTLIMKIIEAKWRIYEEIIVPDKGLSSVRRQALIYTNIFFLFSGPLEKFQRNLKRNTAFFIRVLILRNNIGKMTALSLGHSVLINDNIISIF